MENSSFKSIDGTKVERREGIYLMLMNFTRGVSLVVKDYHEEAKVYSWSTALEQAFADKKKYNSTAQSSQYYWVKIIEK